MSELEKPAEVETTMATNGTGPPEDSGAVAVTEKSYEKENGVEPAAASIEEEQNHEKKDVDAKIDEAAGVKKNVDAKMEEAVGANGAEEKESKEGGGMEEAEPMKVEMEEIEAEERKPLKVEVKEKETEEREPMKVQVEEETKENNAGQETEEKVEVEEKAVEAEEKGEGAEERGEEAKEKGEGVEEAKEKGEETEEKGEESEEKCEAAEEKGEEGQEVQAGKREEEKGTRKKRPRGRKVVAKGGKKEKEGEMAKDVFRTPVVSSVDRPVRERKTVERLVESLEKQPTKGFLIEKGRGTRLKDIPNVAYKLSKRKPDDIKLLHLLLFGRKGKAINFKSHIFQFSGFVWHDNEDKQRAKVKEKLDKCVKDKLLDLCDVFDIPVPRPTSRKEDLAATLLDFMVSPRATTDVILAEKEQSAKSRKRKRVSRGSVSRRSVGAPTRRSRKKWTKSESVSKSEKSENETEDEDEDEGEKDNVNSPLEDVEMKQSEDEQDNESEHENDAAEEEEEYSGKRRGDHKKLSKQRGSSRRAKSNKVSTPKKARSPRSTKSRAQTSLKRFKADEDKYENKKVFSRRKKDDVVPKKRMSSSRGNMKEKKTTGKRAGRPKAKTDRAEESGPTDEELRNTICEILKEVDFNTATFTDILKKLASHYNTDLTARKTSIKLMIQGELTKLAEEAEDEDDDNDDAEHENPESRGQEIEA